jgi:serine/threonine protein kinase
MNVTAESYAAEGEIVGGKFRIGKRIAVGSMGVVVQGRHVELDEPVAIKVLHPNLANPRFTARFVREARNAARIKSEHVPRFIDVGWLHGGLPYLVMEYLEGETLARVIARGTQLPVSDAVDYVLQACEAVAAAHVNGILHRDLNPSNLFLTTRLDGSPLVKVLDFGVSRAFNSSGEREDEGLTVADVTLGSHDFKAPEQLVGRDVDARCDIWALGGILYNLLTLSPPFSGKTAQDIIKTILAATPTPARELRPTIPAELDSVILRCLQLDRERRPASIAKFALFLQQHASEQARHLPMSILKAARRARRVSGSAVAWENEAAQVARDVAAPEVLFVASEDTASEAMVAPSLPRPAPAPLPFTNRGASVPPRRSNPRWAAVAAAVAVAALLLVVAKVATRSLRGDPVAVTAGRALPLPKPTATDRATAVSASGESVHADPTGETPGSGTMTSTAVPPPAPSPVAPAIPPTEVAPAPRPRSNGAATAKSPVARVPIAPPHPRPTSSPGSSGDPWGWER